MFNNFYAHYGKDCEDYWNDCHMCAISGCVPNPTKKSCHAPDSYHERVPLRIDNFVRNAKKCVD